LRLFLLSLAALFLLSGCSSKKVSTVSAKTKALTILNEKNNSWITNAISQEYEKWSGVPYKYGGRTLNGIDCSSLIQIIYEDAFGLEIPRTTNNQALIGHKIDKKSSREGDLVFFKTGSKIRHSGIIIKKDKFVHSSSKHGVIISSLNNPYWKEKYWQTRRILP